MLCYVLVYSKVIHLYTFSFSYSFHYDLLQDDGEKQAHIYSVDVDTTNALELDINKVYNREFYKMQGRTDILDAYLINHIINILQNRVFQKYFEFYDEDKDLEALEFLLPYIEEYNEELDEYMDKDFYCNCIVINNAVDSIDEISHYIPSTIVIVLDENIIKNKKLIKV